MLGDAHELFEFSHALERGGIVLAQQEFVLVEKLDHLIEGDFIVGH